MDNTAKIEYTKRLRCRDTFWKRLLDVQRPYRIHLQALQLGLVLDVGCGIGRNLVNIGGSDRGIGIDHNSYSVEEAKSKGLIAFTPQEFKNSSYAVLAGFDSLLFSHVIEHMRYKEAISLINEYICYLKPGGRIIIITPQEAGYRSDPTHVEFVDFHRAALILKKCGFEILKQYSFPFSRFFGKSFKYNEFVTLGKI